MDCSLPGSCPWDSPWNNIGVGCHALLQEIFWLRVDSFPTEPHGKPKVSLVWWCVCLLSHVWLFVTPWTAFCQALSMGFSRQEYWSGLPFPLPEDLSDPGIESMSPGPHALAGRFFTTWAISEANYVMKDDQLTWIICLYNTIKWQWKSLSYVQHLATPWTIHGLF